MHYAHSVITVTRALAAKCTAVQTENREFKRISEESYCNEKVTYPLDLPAIFTARLRSRVFSAQFSEDSAAKMSGSSVETSQGAFANRFIETASCSFGRLVSTEVARARNSDIEHVFGSIFNFKKSTASVDGKLSATAARSHRFIAW